MYYIENVIDFFDKVERVTRELMFYVEDRKDEDQGMFLFKTPNFIEEDGVKKPFIRALCAEKRMDDEVDDSDYEILSWFNMCQFSLDNENYYDFWHITEDEEILGLFTINPSVQDYKLYLRDITGTFYTIITPQNKGYFDYLFVQKGITSTSYENAVGRRETIYYHNFYLAFYYLNENCGFNIPVDQIDNVTYVALKKDIYGNTKCQLTPMKFDDFFHVKNDFLMGYERSPEVVASIEYARKNYSELFESAPINVDLFGKDLSLNFNDRMLPLAILPHSLDYLLNDDELCVEYRKDIFEKLINKPVAGSKMFDIDKFALNFQSAAELYWGINQSMRSYIRGICRQNKKTTLMYAVWDNYIDNKHFEDVIGVDRIIADPSFLSYELPSLRYVDTFLDLMYEGYDSAVRCKSDIENFNNNFEIYGGGTGIRGALGGMLAGALVGAAAQTAYSTYRTSKFNRSKYESVGKDFMVSEKSQTYFKELIDLDLIYLLLKCFSLTNRELQEDIILRKYEAHPDYNVIFESFIEAYKLYSIALAKYLKLSLLPKYEGYEKYYEMSPVELMKGVLCLFPLYSKFFEKYFEFGGEMSDDLKIYATANFVDLTDLFEKQKEIIEKKKQEELLKEKAKEERRRIREEKKKAKEEQIKAQLESLTDIYGELTVKYPDLFNLLIDNPIFNENKGVEITNHNQISEIIFKYLALTFSPNQKTNLFSGISEKFISKKGNIIKVYGADKIKDNNVLMLFDITVFGSAKEGFVITNEHICVKNTFEQPYSIPVKDIKKISIKEKEIWINDKYKIGVAVSCVKPTEFVYLFSYCICNLLLLLEKGYTVRPVVLNNPAVQTGALKENQFVNSAAGTFKTFLGKIGSALETGASVQTTWKCSCGKENSYESNFCPNCGFKQPAVSQEWFCVSCGKKNDKDSNFCNNCGIKRAE